MKHRFFSLLITILLKDGKRYKERVCDGKGMSREKLGDELRGLLAGALRVIDKSEEVM